ncbi:MAG TPA: ABC transporter ATP-binding protein [Blastocatellia bacterium]|nr:ABC transporter ATP-binding protein [Blastocatellia bacterium]
MKAALQNPAPSETAVIEVRDVTFSYGKPVLHGVSLKVDAGQILSIIGPNGSGKTTLLKIALGILKPVTGSVWLGGRDTKSMSRKEVARAIGYVGQGNSIRFPLTALEFVLQGRFAQGKLLGFESEEDIREARRAMELTGTQQFAGRLVGELSGGEMQLVRLARAVASRPRLLVLDEPVANLDVSHQVRTLDLLRRLTTKSEINPAAAMAAIVVTHELNLAAEFATSVLMLKSGRTLANGLPADVMTAERLKALFDADLFVDTSPASGAPRITLMAPKSSNASRVGESNVV